MAYNKTRLDHPGDFIGGNFEDQWENTLQFVCDMIGNGEWTESDRFVGFEIFKRLLKVYKPD